MRIKCAAACGFDLRFLSFYPSLLDPTVPEPDSTPDNARSSYRAFGALPVERRLELAMLALDSWGENADFNAGLRGMGVDEAYMEVLRAQHRAAKEADDAQAEAYREEGKASVKLKAAMPAAETAYEVV